MANLLNGFLDNLKSGILGPKGNLGDFAHAARLYVDDSFRLAPKSKFLYHVTFNINDSAGITDPPLTNHKHELNMLVKQVDLPKYTIDVDMVQAYNKKRKIQKRIQYDPVAISFHDDNYGVTTALWECYYRYYFKDGNYGDTMTDGSPDMTSPPAYKKPYNRGLTYMSSEMNKFNFGLDNNSLAPFFHSIQIYQMARKTYTCYTLVNPIISGWEHDSLSNEDTGPVQNRMRVEYEAVFYSRGPVSQGKAPKMFGKESGHYDTTPSPNSLSGGGTTSVFGTGGILSGLFGGGGSGPNTYIGSQGGSKGKITLGSIIRTANRIRNLKKLSKDGLRQEGFNILVGAIGKIGQTADASKGVANTHLGKSINSVRGTVTQAIQKTNKLI